MTQQPDIRINLKYFSLEGIKVINCDLLLQLSFKKLLYVEM